MGLFWFAVSLWSCCGPSVSLHLGGETSEVSHPGDVMIGGLFPIHKQVSSKEKHGPITNCSDVDVTMLIRAQAMIYAIEKINELQYLLPNVSIGYKIYDTCGDVSIATRETLKLLEQSHGNQNMCPLLEETPGTGAEGVKVVIGERDSETSVAVARLLALPKVAQISYASTSELLSSKLKFPSFLRTVPSDKQQTKAMAEFVREQKWDIVGVIGSDDEYGKYGSETLIDLFTQIKACIAFKEVLPAEFTQNETLTRIELDKIFKKIQTHPTEAIVIFTKTRNVKAILEEAVKRRVHRTWLASDSWSISIEISGLNNITQIGRVIEAECQACPSGQYASPKKDCCLPKEITFFTWGDGIVIALVVFDSLGVVLTVLVAVLFTVQRSTPIVKAAGGYLCFLALLSLLVCFASVAVGLSEPSDVTCMIEVPLFLLAFTLCISCILANLLQVFVGFNFRLTMTSTLKSLNRPAVVICVCFGVQVLLCSLWLILNPPNKITLNDHETQIIIACFEGSMFLSMAVFLYVCLLSVVCFIFAYNGRQLPDLYKNARYVAVSMLVYLVMCIIFLPFYMTSFSKYRQSIQACALMVTTYSVLICHFGTKCYIMLFKKDLNNESAIAEYIRNHYNQKSIRVLSS
ncbi:G-protein coupled receptor family C group 6 member A-like [Alosa alosa]|uniref:G-protein coupled receptor family C group 6 member A-like n=1 Tax=Alosa alosa TaxID=278164 RepID=UPI0020153838|nr:G-protein coupled receptor family C group 6 member A-like [Alosa alosa]